MMCAQTTRAPLVALAINVQMCVSFSSALVASELNLYAAGQTVAVAFYTNKMTRRFVLPLVLSKMRL